MLDKILEAQKKAEEIKFRLDTIIVRSVVEGGKISVTATGNKILTAISIDPQFLITSDSEQLEELLLTAINNVLQQAEQVSQSEMEAVTKEMMGSLGNLFGK